MVTLDLEQLAESGELFDGHYKLMYPLNTDGATADIWLAVDTNTVDDDESDNSDEEQGLKVAIKVYRPQNALDIEGVQRFRNEFKVVFNCQHSNLLHPVHFSIYKETPYLVLPYCQNGSTELITGQMQRDEDIWKFIYDVASGLSYLHSNNPPIVHQDIKPANILIDDNRNYTITDFGISISRKNRLHDIGENSGTLAYMAPERFIEGTNPVPESDIWALGATLYELITGLVPFGEDGGNYQADEKPSLFYPKNTCSKKIQKLIGACLSKTPQNRPTARQLIEFAKNKSYSESTKWTKKHIMVIGGILAFFVIIGGLFSIANSLERSTTDIAERNVSASVQSQATKATEKSKLSQIAERKAAVVLLDGLDEIPSYQGGSEEMCKYFAKTLRIDSRPDDDRFVSVIIVINRDGTINESINVKTADPDIKRNMEETIKGMPRWNPGRRNGKPIPVQVLFSFLFKDMVHFKTSLSSEIYRIDIND